VIGYEDVNVRRESTAALERFIDAAFPSDRAS
jgi:hypothetical protein